MVDRFCFFAKHCPSHSVRSPILEKKKNKKNPKPNTKKKKKRHQTLCSTVRSQTPTHRTFFSARSKPAHLILDSGVSVVDRIK